MTRVADAEERLGASLPDALADWYALSGAAEFLARTSDDTLATVERLGAGKPFEVGNDGLLVIGVENQGVCEWAVSVRDGADPAVLVAFDPGCSESWQVHAAHFSEYVQALVWDELTFALPYRLAAQDVPPSSRELRLLRSAFHEQVTTFTWPARDNYRFERPGQRLLIWAGDGQADWYLCGATATDLSLLAADLWGCGNLNETLYEADRYDQPSPTELLLGELRAGAVGATRLSRAALGAD